VEDLVHGTGATCINAERNVIESESNKPKVEKKLEQAGLQGKAMVYTVADVLKNATTKSRDGK